MFNKKRTHKYNSKKIEINGIVFDSNLESKFYIFFKSKNWDFEHQVTYEIQPSFVVNDKKIRPITYKADFVLQSNNKLHIYIIDAKGFLTPEFKLKQKLMLYKGLPIICITALKDLSILENAIEENLTPYQLIKKIEDVKKSRSKKFKEKLKK